MLPAQRFGVVSRAGKLCLREGWKGEKKVSRFRNEGQWHLPKSKLISSAEPKVRT